MQQILAPRMILIMCVYASLFYYFWYIRKYKLLYEKNTSWINYNFLKFSVEKI